MRGYLPTSGIEVSQFFNSRTLDVEEIYAPTKSFIASNSDSDEEEIEFILSLLAAEDAQEMREPGTGVACVLAFEIPAELIAAEDESSVQLSAPLTWAMVQCLFEISDDGEELTWFATQEIPENLANWL